MPLTVERVMRVVEYARDQSDRLETLRDYIQRAAQFADQTENPQTLRQLIHDLQVSIDQACQGDRGKRDAYVKEIAHLEHSAKRNKQMAEYMRRYRSREKMITDDKRQDIHRANKSLSFGLGPIEISKPRNPALDDVTLDFVFQGVRERYANIEPGEDYLVAHDIRLILKDYNPTDTDVTFWYNKLLEEGLVERGKFAGEFRPLV